MIGLLKSLWAAAVAVGLTGGLAPIVSLLARGNPRRPDPLIRFWARALLQAAGVDAVVRGLERLPSAGQFVLVLNHQSHFDVVVLFAHLPRHLRFVAKAELFRIPLFGAALEALGNVKVRRDGGAHDQARMADAAEAVRTRVNLVFFAEGTRSPDGCLGTFKKGAASVAIEGGVPIVPAAIAGTRFIMPRGSARIHTGHQVALVIGEPIPVAGLSAADRDGLIQRARERVSELLTEANALLT